MEEIIRINDEFYVLAGSSLADDRTRVLKYGDTFGVFNRFGDIETIGLGEHGIYHEGTRYLSRFVLRLGNETPQLLRSTIRDDNALMTVDAMNVDLSEDRLLIVPRGSLHVFRSKFLHAGACYEHIRVFNYSLNPVKTFIGFDFEADYKDIFEVRGMQRKRRGKAFPASIEGNCVLLSYKGLDAVERRTRIEFSEKSSRLTEKSARFEFALQPRSESSLFITTSFEKDDRQAEVTFFDTALNQSTKEFQNVGLSSTQVVSMDARFNAWLARSAADLRMLLVGNPEADYPYAGVPWFSSVFGRDGILTAMECLWLAPCVAKSVLKFLAETQATEFDPEREAEPGKIVHEMRRGEMAALQEIPFGRYYGSVDATPLFVMLAGAYLERTDDHKFVQTIWPNVMAALNWIDQYGDVDRDGLVEYQRMSSTGLIQQGWKDSHDSIFYSDGTLAEHPIALCEVQGYVYAAKQAGASLARTFGQAVLAESLTRQSLLLREQFDRQFWDDEINNYVIALDGAKTKCKVQSSNPGHCLFTGIATEDRAARIAESLLSDELFCGWGIRTLASNEVRYNPMSYHNGSVWPHDNALAARGLARYGFHGEAARIFSGLLEASSFMEAHRLPELFCGFHRRSQSEAPTLYPVACSPQAWAAGSIYLLLEACLGLTVNSREQYVRFDSRVVPDFLHGTTIEGLRVGEAELDLIVKKDGVQLKAEVLRQRGEVKVNFAPVG